MDIPQLLQDLIRANTGKTENVIFDTDHFEISGGGKLKKIGKFTSPTTGTDISGAGYLDLGDNATFVAGDGDDYKLVRLDEDGQIPLEVFGKLSSQIGGNQITSGRALNTVYQNTTGKAIVVTVSTRIYVPGSESGDSGVHFNIGTTSSPDTIVGTMICESSFNALSRGTPVTIIVPNGYYYSATTFGPREAELVRWFECDLI